MGYEHGDADIDELDTMKTEEAVSRMAADIGKESSKETHDGSRNTIGVTTTPEGFKFVYNTWKKKPAEGIQDHPGPNGIKPALARRLHTIAARHIPRSITGSIS